MPQPYGRYSRMGYGILSGDKKDKMAGEFIRSNPDFIVHLVFDMLENPNVTDMKKLPNFGYEIHQSLLSA